ncbi:TPA: hypothetical protein ACMDQA_001990 [Vibrio cholerae]
MNILTLDPMYSPLHDIIADYLPEGKRYAVLSSYGLMNYTRRYKREYFNELINSYVYSDEDYELVKSDINHYSQYLRKRLNRSLLSEECEYMAKFVNYFRCKLVNSKIDLVLMHNDLRWQHSLAIKICNQLNIRYIVTEQGLFRPHTTVIDPVGVNAYSSVKDVFMKNREGFHGVINKVNVNSSHNSFRSHLNFLIYLLLSSIGEILGKESQIVHNKHTFKDYILRYVKLKFGDKNTSGNNLIGCKRAREKIFVPLQLENDTQLLVHSDFVNNQQVINIITDAFIKSGLNSNYDLVFKLHPNDANTYFFDQCTYLTKSNIDNDFLLDVCLVISVNSSSILNVLNTPTPVITLGRSIYDLPGVAFYSSVLELSENMKMMINDKKMTDIKVRNEYINFLKYKYCIAGAAYHYPKSELNKISKILEI